MLSNTMGSDPIAQNINCPLLITLGDHGWLEADRVIEMVERMRADRRSDITLKVFTAAETAAAQAHADNPTPCQRIHLRLDRFPPRGRCGTVIRRSRRSRRRSNQMPRGVRSPARLSRPQAFLQPGLQRASLPVNSASSLLVEFLEDEFVESFLYCVGDAREVLAGSCPSATSEPPGHRSPRPAAQEALLLQQLRLGRDERRIDMEQL